MATLRILALMVAALFAYSHNTIAAQEIPSLSASNQLLIIEIVLNTVKKGAFLVFSQQDGDWLMREEDLKTMAVLPPYGTPIKTQGGTFYSLKALQVSNVKFDEKKLSLSISLPSDRLPRQIINLLPVHPKIQVPPNNNSSYTNYYALYSGNDTKATGTLKIALESGIRIGDFFYHSNSTHSFGNHQRQDLRYETKITYDTRDTLQRFIVGDFTASSGNLGSVKNLGGISFSKNYSIDPYLIKYPMAGFTGDITTPANAQIFLDNLPLRSEKLFPGQFNLANINYHGGLHTVSVVIKDSLGREQVIKYPYYFSVKNLREGLHDYSYNAGLLRQKLGIESNHYSGWAVSAFHLYGLNDMITLGERGEAEKKRFNIGILGSLRFNNWGVSSTSLAMARDSMGSGWAGVTSYDYQDHNFNSQFQIHYQSPHYETANLLNPLTTINAINHRKLEFGATLDYTVPDIGNFSTHYNYLNSYQNGSQQQVALNYSRSLFNSFNVQLSVVKNFGQLSETDVFLTLSYSAGNDLNVSFAHEQRGDTRRDSFQLGNNTPVGEGFSYRVSGDWSATGDGDVKNFVPSVQYNGAYGIYGLNTQVALNTEGKAHTSYQLGIGGSVAYVDGSVALSRPVTDSFGVVDTNGLAGIKVYQNSQEMGRTNKNGRIFLANLGSYIDNTISIDDKDVPFDYTISEKELHISPALHSGSVIHFDINRLQIIQGLLNIKVGNSFIPAENVDLIVVINQIPKTFPTGKEGEFYVENLKSGKYPASFDQGNRHCQFELVIPESKEMIIDLGKLYVCYFPK